MCENFIEIGCKHTTTLYTAVTLSSLLHPKPFSESNAIETRKRRGFAQGCALELECLSHPSSEKKPRVKFQPNRKCGATFGRLLIDPNLSVDNTYEVESVSQRRPLAPELVLIGNYWQTAAFNEKNEICIQTLTGSRGQPSTEYIHSKADHSFLLTFEYTTLALENHWRSIHFHTYILMKIPSYRVSSWPMTLASAKSSQKISAKNLQQFKQYIWRSLLICNKTWKKLTKHSSTG